MTAALTTMPALLAVLGRRIDAGRMPWYHPARTAAAVPTTAPGHGWRQR